MKINKFGLSLRNDLSRLADLGRVLITKSTILSCINYIHWLRQLSFQVWTKQMQEMLNSRKRGDHAFRDKDFRVAIDCYTQVIFTYTSMSDSFLLVLVCD